MSAVSSSNCLLKFLVNSLKISISGFISLAILSLGCFFYYNIPSHYTDKDNVTAYRNDVNAFYSKGTEGFGWGWTNNEGYVNTDNFTHGMDIDILVMGSSHMEAFQIMQENSAACLLNSQYGLKVYNVGVSGHRFALCASNLKAAVDKYRPSKFVVIEAASVNLTKKEAINVIHNRVPKQSAYDQGILSILRSIWYLRLLYAQYIAPSSRQIFMPSPQGENIAKEPADPEILSEMLGTMNDAVSLSGAKLIIAYHPRVSLNKDGTLSVNDIHENIKLFSVLCAENGIYFLNMAERFLSEYERDYTLPYGFWNTSVGKGHMNTEGHRMFADEIYALIKRIEAAVLADHLSVFVDDVFGVPVAFHWATIILAVISYSMQIYFDFSGYSDIAIGCAKCLGYDFMTNFNLPYISRSVTEFWRRWHISLSGWLRDYLYIPLGGNRCGKFRQLVNLMITMLLGGLWHGAKWTFVFWGGLNGLALCAEKIFSSRKKSTGIFTGLMKIVAVFSFISFTWIFFRAENFYDAWVVIRGIFTLQDGIRQPFFWTFASLAILIVSEIAASFRAGRENLGAVTGFTPIMNLNTIAGLTTFFVFVGLILGLAFTGENPFVYFQF